MFTQQNSTFFKAKELDCIFYLHWKNKLKDEIKKLGNDPAILDELHDKGDVEEFDVLYKKYMRLPEGLRQDMQSPWEFLMLIGNRKSYISAKNSCQKILEHENKWGMNAIHFAALSGEPNAIELCISNKGGLKINWDKETYKNLNILHCAILSGEVKQIEKVLELEKINGKQLPATSSKGKNILHFAASTGNIAVLNKVLDIAAERKLNIYAADQSDANALDYAKTSPNKTKAEVILKLHQLGFKSSAETCIFGEARPTLQRLRCT